MTILNDESGFDFDGPSNLSLLRYRYEHCMLSFGESRVQLAAFCFIHGIICEKEKYLPSIEGEADGGNLRCLSVTGAISPSSPLINSRHRNTSSFKLSMLNLGNLFPRGK